MHRRDDLVYKRRSSKEMPLKLFFFFRLQHPEKFLVDLYERVLIGQSRAFGELSCKLFTEVGTELHLQL